MGSEQQPKQIGTMKDSRLSLLRYYYRMECSSVFFLQLVDCTFQLTGNQNYQQMPGKVGSLGLYF